MFRVQHAVVFVFLALMFVLSSCAGHEGLKAGLHKSVDTPSSPVIEKIDVSVSVAPPDPQPESLDYRIGVGDILSVMVYARPDLSTGITTGGTKGSRVDGNGNIHLPLIGAVAATGKTVGMVRDSVTSALRTYV